MQRYLSVFLFFIWGFFSTYGNAQIVAKNSFSAFSNSMPNDTLLLVAGQVQSNAMLVEGFRVGFLPLTDQFLNVQEMIVDQFSVFPNPFINAFNLSTTNSFSVTIYQLDGELVLTKAVFPGLNTLDLSEFAAGIYILVGEKDKQIICRNKMIKQ
jgi:hypothetical protein